MAHHPVGQRVGKVGTVVAVAGAHGLGGGRMLAGSASRAEKGAGRAWSVGARQESGAGGRLARFAADHYPGTPQARGRAWHRGSGFPAGESASAPFYRARRGRQRVLGGLFARPLHRAVQLLAQQLHVGNLVQVLGDPDIGAAQVQQLDPPGCRPGGHRIRPMGDSSPAARSYLSSQRRYSSIWPLWAGWTFSSFNSTATSRRRRRWQ